MNKKYIICCEGKEKKGRWFSTSRIYYKNQKNQKKKKKKQKIKTKPKKKKYLGNIWTDTRHIKSVMYP